MQHITEYVSEDIAKVVNEISSIMNTEELKNSLNIARALKKCIAAILNDTNEETVGKITDHDMQQFELTQNLEVTLSVLSKDALENLHELVPLINKDTVEKMATVVDNLKSNLSLVKTSYQEVHKFVNVVQHEYKTESEIAKPVIKGIAETSQQAQFLSEDTKILAVEITQTDAEESITVIPVEPTPKMVETSAPISTDFSEGFIENTSMPQDIISKQGQQATAERCEMEETKKEITVEHAASTSNKSYICTSAETLQIEANEMNRDETCVEETSNDAMLIQEVNTFQMAGENAAIDEVTAGTDKVIEEMTSSEVLEQNLTQDDAELGLFVVTDKKVDQLSATSDAAVAAESYASELLEPNTSEKIVLPEEQTTLTSTEVSVKTTTGKCIVIYQKIIFFLLSEVRMTLCLCET